MPARTERPRHRGSLEVVSGATFRGDPYRVLDVRHDASTEDIKARWREPHILFNYALKTATHYHYAEVARAVAAVDPETGAMSDAGKPFSRSRKAEPATEKKVKAKEVMAA